jgi:ectoine hydroxylase-related dioxygenase (phytanoyl-CoA dioxygenase family)
VADNAGSEFLPDAVPLFAAAGDVTIVNRQALHGSFANTSEDMRVSLTFGFHRRTSVLGARGALSQSNDEVYDAQRIDRRSKFVAVAIDARQQFYPNESRYRLPAHAGPRSRISTLKRELGAGDSRLQFARPVDLIVRVEAK